MFNQKHNQKGFTLIEVLVTIGIIGVLSSVVVFSVSQVREKNKITAIKVTLANLYMQAKTNEITYGNFSNSNPHNNDLTCTGPNGNLAEIIKPLEDRNENLIIRCYSLNGTNKGGDFAGDDYYRFAATALIYDNNELKAWSVDEHGVVQWDTENMVAAREPWLTATGTCASSGGRLPSAEQFKTLSYALKGSQSNSYNGSGITKGVFQSGAPYWSNTESLKPNQSYTQFMGNGLLVSLSKNESYYVRCVR